MTEKFSFHDNSDFYHETSCSSKRINVASAKKYETTGTYITLRLFKKDSEEFQFNQRITLSAAEFDLLGQKLKTIQDLSSRGIAKKKNEDNDLVVKVILKKDLTAKVEEQKKHDKK